MGQTFGLWDDVSSTAETAASVSDTQGVTFVPSLFGLRAPHNCNRAKGAFVGLSTSASRAHLVRSVLEGVCWRLFELLQAIRRGPTPVKSVRIDGGVSKNDFICQFLADIFQLPIVRGGDEEASVRGAAMMALVTAGVLQWSEEGRQRMRELIRTKDRTFLPQMSQTEVQARYLLWIDAVERIRD